MSPSEEVQSSDLGLFIAASPVSYEDDDLGGYHSRVIRRRHHGHMVRRPWCAAAAATTAAVLGAIAAMVTSFLLRRFIGSPASPGPASTPEGVLATSEETAPGNKHGSPRRRRAMIVVKHGVTPTVCALVTVGIVTAAYAYYLRPDSSLPQPGEPYVVVTFGQRHFTSAPLKMTAWLRAESLPDSKTSMALDIDLNGPDLTYPGWEIQAFVPNGVSVPGSLNNDPSVGQVIPRAGGDDVVNITPGPQQDATYQATFIWHNLSNGPMQERDASLVAEFPQIHVQNEVSFNSPDTFTPPTPAVTLSRKLQPPGSDFAYLGGLPPDHEDNFTWSWKGVGGARVSGSTDFPPMTIEARSAVEDEKSHNAEFQSGIYFGVAAAALIAALQEFLNSARRRKNQPESQPTADHPSLPRSSHHAPSP